MDAAVYGIRLSKPLNLSSSSLAQDFKDWKDEFNVYMLGSGKTTRPKEEQAALLLNLAGQDVIKISKHFSYDAGEDEKDPYVLLAKIENYCSPRSNEVLEAFCFLKLEYTQPFDNYLIELRRHAASCNYGDATDRMIRDKLVLSVKPAVQKILLRESNLTLNKAITICRTYEHAEAFIEEMSSGSTESSHVPISNVQDFTAKRQSQRKNEMQVLC